MNSWKENLSDILTTKTGHQIYPNAIEADRDIGAHVPTGVCQRNHPLILTHFRTQGLEQLGNLFVILPTEDYELLEAGSISANEYVSKSVWSYGYFLPSTYWWPVEGDKTLGINNTEKVKTFLTIIRCYTYSYSKGYPPPLSLCDGCDLKSCPITKYKPKCTIKELGFDNLSKDLTQFESLLRKKITETFGYEIGSMKPVSNLQNIHLSEGCMKGKINVLYPSRIKAQLCYHPNSTDLEQLVESLEYSLSFRQRMKQKIFKFKKSLKSLF